MKRYAESLVLGKFMPPHAGHLHLIETALDSSDLVHVVVCHNPGQPIPGAARARAVREAFSGNRSVRVVELMDEGMPQHDRECESLDEFYSRWVPPVLALAPGIRSVFTSEDYGEDFARYLGVEHVMVDRDRVRHPVSGTAIRADPMGHWDSIAPAIRHHFVRRVAVMGTESCGKSTLVERLARHYSTEFVPEWGRTVYEMNGNRVGIEDFVPIAEGRQAIEDRLASSANRLLFCDTEDITTFLFSQMYCPDEWRQVEPWFERAIEEKPAYDLYLLLRPDCPAVQDGTRNFLDERWAHHERIRAELVARGREFREVGGDWDERFASAVDLVNRLVCDKQIGDDPL